MIYRAKLRSISDHISSLFIFSLFRWTGSNTNPNNNDGQGKAGTDRSNVLLLEKLRYPKGKPKSNVYGQFGGSYPEHLDRVSFLGLKRNDLVTMATLNNGIKSFLFLSLQAAVL